MMIFIILILNLIIIYLLLSKKKDATYPKITIGGDISPDNESPHEKDAWESFDYYSAVSIPALGKYKILYKDSQGQTTEREIEVREVLKNKEGYAVEAKCLLRNANRTFISFRILSSVNADTGEIVENLAEDAIQQFNNSDKGVITTAINNDWESIQILMFISKADGRMLKNEREIIAEYIKKTNTSFALNDSLLDEIIKNLASPDQVEFNNYLKKLRSDKSKLMDLIEYSRRIIDTQKIVSPLETAALELIHKAAN